MATHKRGKIVTILAPAIENEEYGNENLFDPTSITVKVTDPLDAVKVAETAMLQKETGEYYYNVPTTASWETGAYDVEVVITDAGDTDTTTSTFTLE